MIARIQIAGIPCEWLPLSSSVHTDASDRHQRLRQKAVEPSFVSLFCQCTPFISVASAVGNARGKQKEIDKTCLIWAVECAKHLSIVAEAELRGSEQLLVDCKKVPKIVRSFESHSMS